MHWGSIPSSEKNFFLGHYDTISGAHLASNPKGIRRCVFGGGRRVKRLERVADHSPVFSVHPQRENVTVYGEYTLDILGSNLEAATDYHDKGLS
jgi:hypothetical protein